MPHNLKEQVTPVYILTGFLGSGKTTLLQRLLGKWQDEGLRPAVIMNEIGDVNLDGLLVSDDVAMAEILSGCICCSVRGDLSYQMYELIHQESPDVIIIEATGAANPMEILDAVTEVALTAKIDIRPIITVVDAIHLLELHESQKGKTYRLMMDQIRCGSVIIANKIDRLTSDQVEEVLSLLKRLNPYAKLRSAVRCEVDLQAITMTDPKLETSRKTKAIIGHKERERLGNKGQVHECEHGHEHDDKCAHNHNDHYEHTHVCEQDQYHHSHHHVTSFTYYMKGPVNSERFEELIRELPREVYRGKGIVTFSDTASRFLFQYAYRESDYMKITPQGDVPDVVVFIGEHFDQQELMARLNRLEAGAAVDHE